MYKYSEIPPGKEEDIIFLKCVASETVLIEFFKKWRNNEPIRKSTNFFTTGSITWILKSFWNTSSWSAHIENNKHSMNFERSFFEEIKLLDLPWRLKTQAEMLRDGQIVPGDTRPGVWNSSMERYFGARIPERILKEKFDFNLAMTGSSKSFCIAELGAWSYRYEQMTYAPLEGDIDSKQVPDKPSVPTVSETPVRYRFKTVDEFKAEGCWSEAHGMATGLGIRTKEFFKQTFSEPFDYSLVPSKYKGILGKDIYGITIDEITEDLYKSHTGHIPLFWGKINKEWFTSAPLPVAIQGKTLQEQVAEAEKKLADEFCIKHPLFLGYRLLTAEEAKKKLGWNYSAEMAYGWGRADNKFFKGFKVPEEYSEIYGRDIYGLFLPGITKEDYESASERIQFQTKPINKAWITECYTGDGHKIASKPCNSMSTAVIQSYAAAEMMRLYTERRGLNPYESEGSLQLREMRPSNKLNAEVSADSRLLEEAKIHLYISKKSNLLTIN